MTKQKLLLISGVPLHPQNSGGATRLKYTFKYLSEKYEIDFKEITPTKKSLFTTLFLGIPYHMSNYYDKELCNLIQKTDIQNIRIEGTQLLYLAKYLKPQSISTFVALDISAISFWRRAFESKNPLQIAIRLVSALQTYIYEKKYLPKFSRVLVMSQRDKEIARKMYGLTNISISPNGIEKVVFLPVTKHDVITMGYIGSSAHTPNIAALKYLTSQILPKLKAAGYKYILLVLGNYDKHPIDDENIEFVDQVDDLKEFYKKIDMLVAPIYSGSGTRLKILESLSYGKPVITTNVGAEGIEIKSKYLDIGDEDWTLRILRCYTTLDSYEKEQKELEKQLLLLTWENIFKPEL